MSESGDEIIHLNEETEVAPPLDENRQELEGNGIIPSNEETQVALPSDEHQLAVAQRKLKVHLHKGNFVQPNFGPQINKKHVEANTIEHATISHVHHHYGGADESEESSSTSGATGAIPKQKHDEGIVQITDDIFMNTKKPLKEGAKIYEGYQEHVTGQRLPLAIKAIVPCTKKSIREVKHLVKLASHPNVVRIIQSKKENTRLPTLYIAMELCRSMDLQDILNENRENKFPLDFKKTMSYSRQIVSGLRHIHRNRIIHGDLKPENILFSLNGDQIKLSDFGISRQLRKLLFATKITGQGTDGYRAPETYYSNVISLMADIYSLGITLYSLFTNGKHPFGEEPDLWMYNIKKNKGRDLSGLPEEMEAKKDELLELLDKMLEHDPVKRPNIEEISEHPFFSWSDASTAQVSTGQESLNQTPQPEAASGEIPDMFFLTSDPDLALEEKQANEVPTFHPGDSHPSSSHEAGARIVSDNIEKEESLASEMPRQWENRKSKESEKIDVDVSHEAASYYQAMPSVHPVGATSHPSAVPRNRDVGNNAKEEESRKDLESKVLEKIESDEAQPEAESSEITDGATGGWSESEKSETLRKMKILGMDVRKLHNWRVTISRSRLKCDKSINNVDQGCVIYCPIRKEPSLPSLPVRINGRERLISELQKIRLPGSARRHNSSELWLWPGLVIWFDDDTFQLFANNCSNAQAEFCNIYSPGSHSEVASSILPIGISTPIFSIREFVDLLDSGKCEGKQNIIGVEGVQIKVVDDPHDFTIIEMLHFMDD